MSLQLVAVNGTQLPTVKTPESGSSAATSISLNAYHISIISSGQRHCFACNCADVKIELIDSNIMTAAFIIAHAMCVVHVSYKNENNKKLSAAAIVIIIVSIIDESTMK